MYFNDLCNLLLVEKPYDKDNYCFERGAKKSDGSDGWADVWKRNCFGWENKKPGRDLNAAYKQLTDYAGKLDNPPLLIVCDRERIIIHTAFTGYPDETTEIRIDDLIDEGVRQKLSWVFTAPSKFKPEKSTSAITEDAAKKFAPIAKSMRDRGIDKEIAAHFLMQCIFCMFAEDENLLPESLFTNLLQRSVDDPKNAAERILSLFTLMQKGKGLYGDYEIPYFNGGLFYRIVVPELTSSDISALYEAASSLDWRAIEPSIFGTLFERGLDPEDRAPLGAHYTDVATIDKLIRPLITEPLLAEWREAKELIAAGYDKGQRSKAYKDAQEAHSRFLVRLQDFRVLDPACGSGNFLYLSLKALRDIEKQVHLEADVYGFHPPVFMNTGPRNILGIEKNEYAAELARVAIWIGDIQWCRRNGWEIARNPILQALDGIENRDAIMEPGNIEPTWPKADVIIGNPPFLGGSKMLGELGGSYVENLRVLYKDRVPGGADLVTYWFEKARDQIANGQAKAAGLVATNSIRGGANRKVLQRVIESAPIFEAWSDERWVNEGAAVRVSLICFGDNECRKLDGEAVKEIYGDLTANSEAASLNLSMATSLISNLSTSFRGADKIGAFDVPGEIARKWLALPSNPNGKRNNDVIRPWANGMDVVRRSSDTWIIDFANMDESSASLYEEPFEYVVKNVKPNRILNRRETRAKYWWRHGEVMPSMRAALQKVDRYIITPRVSKHRVFAWVPSVVLADSAVIAIARQDDTTFGILHSQFHEIWSLRMCTWMGKGNDPRYTPTTCFETFPFPKGLTPADTRPKTEEESRSLGYIPLIGTVGNNGDKIEPIVPFSRPVPAIIADASQRIHAEKIAEAAFKLNQLRESWLNPPEWVEWVITPEEAKAGYPKRPVSRPGQEKELHKRTLTNLYNQRPSWLTNAHKNLDKAVAAAYGWNDYTSEMPDDVILSRLLALNKEIPTAEKKK